MSVMPSPAIAAVMRLVLLVRAPAAGGRSVPSPGACGVLRLAPELHELGVEVLHVREDLRVVARQVVLGHQPERRGGLGHLRAPAVPGARGGPAWNDVG